jgi:hypothetical protein
MAKTSTCDHTLRLLGQALTTGAVVELAGRALVRVTAPGPVVPHDRTGTWLGFMAPEPGLYACCPLWQGVPAALLGPACRGWLRLGEVDELAELLPVAEWLAALGERDAHAFAIGLLHGLAHTAQEGVADGGTRPLIRSVDSLARELFG